jgi:hypothetical protein
MKYWEIIADKLSKLLIPKDERSGSLMRIAKTGKDLSFGQMKY